MRTAVTHGAFAPLVTNHRRSNSMLRKLTKKRYLALVTVAVLAITGAAIAYFSSTGSGTSQAKVGSSTTLSVTFGAESGTMYPGTGTSTIPYTIANPAGSGVQNL